MSDGNLFPNPLSSDSVKDTEEFGRNFMKTAFLKWRSGTGESSSARKSRYEYNRLFAMGKQPMQEYKDALDLDGDLSVIQLIYEPLPIAIPFIKRLLDRYLQRTEKIQCNTIDPVSQSKKQKAKDEAMFKMKNKADIQAIQQEAGANVVEFSEDDPTTEQELDMQFGFNYKQREEVIMEQGIDLVFYDNQWDSILKKRIIYDLITSGIAQVKPYIDPNGRIKIKFTKPENIISSYTEWDDFRDCQYQGEVYDLSIYDIRLKYPKKVEEMGGEAKLFALAQQFKGINGNPSWDTSWNWQSGQGIARPYDSFKIAVVELSLKTLGNLKYELNTDKYGKEVLDKSIVKRTRPQKYLESKPFEVEYSGVYIIDTDIVLEWGKAKNMVKPEQNLQEVILPYVTFMYDNNKMTNTPLIETMIPSIKKMQLVDLQQQKIIANAAPDGFNVDISTMSDVDLGTGHGELNPMQLYKIYKQTGVNYYKRIADDGNAQRQAPIEPTNVPFSGKLEQLMNVWNSEYDKLNKIIGDNNLASGNISNQATGKSVLENAKNIAESASNYIYYSYINMMEKTAKITMHRLWDILVYGKKDGVTYYDGYRKALGTDKIEYIRVEADDDFEKTNFDTKIEAVLDDKEIQYFEQNIQMVLSGDPTMLPDVTQARLLAKTNIKYATYYLMARYEKRLKQKAQEAQQNSQANTEAATAAANAKTEGDIKLETVKAQLKQESQKQELEYQRELEAIKYFGIAKAKIIDKLLSQEGATIQSLPPFLLEGMDIVTKTETELLIAQQQQQQQEMAQQQQAEQQQAMMEQQQQMQQQQGAPQGQEQGQQQEQGQPQQQEQPQESEQMMPQ